jgi:plastocyanin
MSDTWSHRRRRIPPVALVAFLFGACGSGSDEAAPNGEAVAAMPTQGVHGTAPVASGGIPAVITLTPLSANAGAGRIPTPAEPVIDQFGLAFSPAHLIVHIGDTIRFTNSESALTHNVHVRSVDGVTTLLDEDVVTGESIELAMDAEGAYDVLCDMHPGMAAFIFVTSAPYATFAEAQGAFILDGVPSGDYQVTVWSRAESQRRTQRITVGTGATEVQLTPIG